MYDRAAILLRGPGAALNFPIEEYAEDPVLQVSWCVSNMLHNRGASCLLHACSSAGGRMAHI